MAKVRNAVRDTAEFGAAGEQFLEFEGAVLVEPVRMAGDQPRRSADGQVRRDGRGGLAAGAQGLQVAADGAIAAAIAHGADLGAEPDGVRASLVPALVQVAEVGLDAVPALAGAGGQILGGGRVGVAEDRLAVQAQCLRDSGYSNSLVIQGMHCCVALAALDGAQTFYLHRDPFRRPCQSPPLVLPAVGQRTTLQLPLQPRDLGI
ncbi:hypothetical protein ACIOJE_41160, partial [Kitasatospora sp. NPDC087861]|uniref:hypothetical protein n=1 Tax=Kitasatospora sp. NPDC087861 TaxID=3364070 RepID=UPI0038065370